VTLSLFEDGQTEAGSAVTIAVVKHVLRSVVNSGHEKFSGCTAVDHTSGSLK